jgi:hypothetical protein
MKSQIKLWVKSTHLASIIVPPDFNHGIRSTYLPKPWWRSWSKSRRMRRIKSRSETLKLIRMLWPTVATREFRRMSILPSLWFRWLSGRQVNSVAVGLSWIAFVGLKFSYLDCDWKPWEWVHAKPRSVCKCLDGWSRVRVHSQLEQ